MIILKDISQINERLNTIFKLEHPFVGMSFVNELLPLDLLENKLENTGLILGKEKEIEELSLLIFQLKDFSVALCNLTNMFLISKNYMSVYYFTSKFFISHIGNIHYHSEGQFNYKQRFFDRFIEIVKTCKLEKETYMPFIFEIFKADPSNALSIWKAPALEYMKDFYSKNTEWVETFLSESARKVEMIDLLCEFNTQKGLAVAVNNYEKNSSNAEKLLSIFKENKTQLLLFIDKNIDINNQIQLSKFANILLELGQDTDAKSRLEEIYKITTDVSLRNLISERVGVVETTSFKTEKQFLFAVRKEMNENNTAERALGLVFKKLGLKYASGLEVDNQGASFLVNLFKEDSNLLNLKKYSSLENVFEVLSLEKFLEKFYFLMLNQEDINANKWVTRMVGLLSGKELEEKLYSFNKLLYEENRVKEARYLTLVMIASQKNGVFDFLKEMISSNNKTFKSLENQFLKTYADYNNLPLEKILDQVVSEELSSTNLKEQTQRLFEAFIADRKYTKGEFEELFIKHKLFNHLGQGIVFGEYRFGGLYNAFILKGQSKTFVVGKELSESEALIGIVHPQDCDTRFQAVLNAVEKPLFNQFEEMLYNVKDFSRSSVFVNVFAGMMIKPYEFYQRLKQADFKINKEETSLTFNSFIHINESLSLVAEIELEKPIQLSNPYMTVANLYFYQLNDVLYSEGKFITNKQNAIGVGAIPYRYFSYILTNIINSVKVAR